MAPRKLSDTDKQAIAQLYCQPGETTSTLADKFGVSSSTISRVLRQSFSADDYAQITQWKRSGEQGPLHLSDQVAVDNASDHFGHSDQGVAETAPDQSDSSTAPVNRRRSRQRSQPPSAETAPPASQSDNDLAAGTEITSLADESATAPLVSTEDEAVAAWVPDDLDGADDFTDDYDDEDDEDEDGEWEEDADEGASPPPPRHDHLEVLPFEQLALKKPCYLVVDRLSELITCPLKDFGELGLIPQEEEQARTLPVFDNHRVARRFARRNQRIIKVPDGMLLTKAQPYLEAKGITRLLFDGQVYALN